MGGRTSRCPVEHGRRAAYSDALAPRGRRPIPRSGLGRPPAPERPGRLDLEFQATLRDQRKHDHRPDHGGRSLPAGEKLQRLRLHRYDRGGRDPGRHNGRGPVHRRATVSGLATSADRRGLSAPTAQRAEGSLHRRWRGHPAGGNRHGAPTSRQLWDAGAPAGQR